MDFFETETDAHTVLDGERDGGRDAAGDPRRVAGIVASVTLALFAANVTVWILVAGPGSLATQDAYVGLALHGVVVAGLVVGIRYLRRGSLEPDRYPRILRWYAGGLVSFLGLNLALIAAFATGEPAADASWALFAANIGAAAGLTVGIVEARAVDRAVRAERTAVRASTFERQRDFLEYINRLLRHEILNNVQVVQGQVSMLEDAPDEETVDRRMKTIRRRLRQMAEVVEDVREVIRTTSGKTAFEPVALSAVVEERLSSVAGSYDGVETDLALEAEPVVRGDTLLPRIFDNLFENAIEHNTGGAAEIDVTVTREDGVATVTVADDGPGIPNAQVDTLFEHTGGTHGMGLYLIDVLAARYGGAVELADTGPDGSTFVVELPVCADDTTDPIVPTQRESEAGGPLLTDSDRVE